MMESMDDFIERLASPTAVPGGGAAAASVAIIAASLNSMVSGITMGKKKYSSRRDMMEEINRRSGLLRNELRDLMKQDEIAFNMIVSAWKMPQSSEEEKKSREKQMAAAIRSAIAVPWRIARASFDILRDSQIIALYGLKSAVTDSMCAAEFSIAAIRGVLQNVAINIRDADDQLRNSEDMKMRIFLEDSENVYRQVRKAVALKMEEK